MQPAQSYSSVQSAEDGLLLIRGSGVERRRLVLNRSRDSALALPDGSQLAPQDWRLLA